MGTTRKQLTGALMASAAIILGAAGTAAAQENQAGEVIGNTFTLDYSVGGTPQTGISNDPNADPNDYAQQGTPTLFTVDRRVDLEVTALGGPANAAPGQAEVSSFFSLVNEGNDDFRYTLAAANNTTNTGVIDPNDADRDNFDYANTATYAWYVPANGTCSTTVSDYSSTGPSVSTDIPADGTVCVRVVTDVPAGTADTAQSGVYLTATAVQPDTWANEGVADADAGTASAGQPLVAANGNTVEGEAQNVFLDDDGANPNDANRDGTNSDQSFVLVSAANLSATKSVFAVATNGNNCETRPVPATQPGGQYAVPGSCMIYVIEVQNRGGNAATDIDLTDVLPEGLTFVSAAFATFTNGSLAEPAAAQDCTATACTVSLTGARLAAGSTATPTVGTLTIRALVNGS